MKNIYDTVSFECSRMVTTAYSTSFSRGIKILSKKFHAPIYGIYGFVRLADEIVDSWQGYDQAGMLAELKTETFRAIETRISTNPILHSFQQVVNQYKIPGDLIESFLFSMESDLAQHEYDRNDFNKYIFGSAEVVGLMCLRVFCEGDEQLYERLKEPAMQLGSVFQKVNFLRDMKYDSATLGRIYFPGLDPENFTREEKLNIEHEITIEFEQALQGIRQLPATARRGVYLAYCYYRELFKKIKTKEPHEIMKGRIRISDTHKFFLLIRSSLQLSLKLI